LPRFGKLDVVVNRGVNRCLGYDLLAQVNGAAGAFVVNTVTVGTRAGTTALNPAGDDACPRLRRLSACPRR
jgi:hypothetical protein